MWGKTGENTGKTASDTIIGTITGTASAALIPFFYKAYGN